MNTVEPIRDSKVINRIAECLKEKNERDYVLFMTGIHLGRRISDMLELDVGDVKNKDYIYIRESKTGKESRVIINDELKQIYKEYIKNNKLKSYQPLFQSREGINKPITREMAWIILNKAAKEVGYTESIGCHSLRKTFGYWLYKETGDIVAIQELLNHDDPSVTKRYIGVNQDSKDKIVRGLSFRKRR